MKKLVLFVILGISVFSSCDYLLGGNAKIFYVNLYKEDFDVQLGEDLDPVFYMDEALEPYSTSVLVETSAIGSHSLYYAPSSEADMEKWGAKCSIEAGKIHLILIDQTGMPRYYTLEEEEGEGSFVCFINGSDLEMDSIEIGEAWNEDIVASYENPGPYGVSDFKAFTEGDYSLFWKYKTEEDYYFYTEDEGPSKIPIVKGEYDLFLTYVDEDGYQSYGFYEISPDAAYE